MTPVAIFSRRKCWYQWSSVHVLQTHHNTRLLAGLLRTAD